MARRSRRTVLLIACGAWLLGLGGMLLFPSVASAHAVLLRSNPAQDAVLSSPPAQVQMWFSEPLNPTNTTSYIVNAATSTPDNMTIAATHVDRGDAHVSASDSHELDVSLKPDLPPAIYLVYYLTQSAADGHVLTGTFLFTIANPDGTVPTLSQSFAAGLQSSTSPGLSSMQALVSALMISLVELGMVFWLGAQLWRTFIIELAETRDQPQQTFYQETVQRFERRFSIPLLLLLLFANVGVLVGQALTLTGSAHWWRALAPSLLSSQLGGQFGLFWVMREGVVLLALIIAISLVVFKKRPRVVDVVYPWVNLALGVALAGAVVLSGHATSVEKTLVVPSGIVDWLHVLAAALWVGGMLYLAGVCLPLLKGKTLQEKVSTLLNTLPRYSPLAIIGVIIMAVTGPSDASAHMLSWQQLFTTAYGRTLIVKLSLIACMLLISAAHVFLLRPRLKKTYQKYQGALETQLVSDTASQSLRDAAARTQQRLEGRVSRQAGWLIRLLNWEPVLGVAVLLCTGFLAVSAGSLQPAATLPLPGLASQQLTAPPKPFHTTVETTDKLYTVTLSVSPNRLGTNEFTVQVHNKQGKLETLIGVSISASLIDMMDMGTTTIALQSDGKGTFSAKGDLSMSGNWQLDIRVRTPDAKIHTAPCQLSNR